MNPIQLEEAYKNFTTNLSKWAPDGCLHVDLKLLQDLGLLGDWESSSPSESLNQQFHVVETSDKVTLFNKQFVVWITPQLQPDISSTIIMLALIQNLQPHLEVVYVTSGVYNTPKYILKLLQHFMNEVIDTEKILSSIEKEQ
jgi:hypothetical protein